MFYSQFILAKKGPLGTIWIAAHLERKLRKNQIADTDIGDSVDSILSPDVPIALRLSSHLLLGVVRIYNKKVNYLFDDCSEALLKIKQAFRSATVDLPPEEAKAPYHSITLPETFDLDDFELPDSDIFQGNYVDHHISSKEQITLQDPMEGVSYSTSNFGLDERFGDGDASGLDLDEELLLDKVGSAGYADERVDPHTSFASISPLKQDEHPEDGAANSETMVDDDGENDDLMDFAQAPSTPGLVEQPNLSNVRDASACEDHLESEDHLLASAAKENTNDVPFEEKREVHWCSQNDILPDIHHGSAKDTEHVSNGLEIEDSKLEGESLIGTHVLTENKIIKEYDDPCQEDLQTEAVKDETKDDNEGPNEIYLDKSDSEISGLVNSSGKQTSEGLSVEDVTPLVVDVSHCVVDISVHQKSHNDASVLGLEDHVGSFKEKPDIQVGEETSCAPYFDARDKEVANEALVLRPCNSEHPCVMNPVSNMSTDLESDSPLANFGKEEASLKGKASSLTDNSEQNLKENQVEERMSGEEILVSAAEANDQLYNANSQNKLEENLENSIQLDLPDPEKLLSVPEGHMDLHGDILAEVSPRDFGKLAEGDTGSKTAVGRKRTLTESTLTEQSLNSVESSRQVRAKRTVESVPDDDDLLSSILVGRSSVLKVKPTPLLEVTSVKRNRTAPRPGPPKRKLLMDDSMVLHGDTIRKQLTSTEDIRRVRKKAPCTFLEISMIQKQRMEDDIFLQPCFTGVSAELASLHSLVYDLSQIQVCQNDALDASLDIMTKLGQPSQNDESGGALEAKVELNSTFCNDKHGAASEAVTELHLASPNKENHDLEGDQGTKVGEESELGLNTEPFILRDNDMADPSLMIPFPTENMVTDNHSSVEVNINQEHSKPSSGGGPHSLEQELSENVAAEERSRINLGSENLALAAEVEAPDLTAHAIDGTVDAYAVANQRAEMRSVELDHVVDEGQLVSRTEVLEKDSDANGEAEALLAPNNDILQDVPYAAAAAAATAFDLAQDANRGEVENNVHHENYDIRYEVQKEVELSYPAAHSGLVDSLFKNGGINNPEAYHPNMADTGISGFDMRDQDELNYAAAVNDTEFLNVDDDELTEMDDDYFPDGEEKQLTENSGWSSRTRAVSKYLQTAFFKEAERGKDSLSMDNLLASKSRKEASRMFFETLVLKTRDYIRVEQHKPFDDITIKPQTRLLKSDF